MITLRSKTQQRRLEKLIDAANLFRNICLELTPEREMLAVVAKQVVLRLTKPFQCAAQHLLRRIDFDFHVLVHAEKIVRNLL